MNNKKIVILTLLVFVIIFAAVLLLNKGDKNAEQENNERLEVPIQNQPILGSSDSPVTVVEFGDYKCPSCKAWSENIFPKLDEEYIKTEKIKFSYVNVLFHGKESVLAALASESVFKHDPELFWAFHKGIFDTQPETQSHDDPWVTPESLVEIAEKYVPQIDLKKLESDIRNATTMEEVELDDKLVKEVDVQFTPTIVINGVMLEDPFDYKAITSLIEKGLEE